LARFQAESIAADIVKQGGPANVHERQAIALIAYLQRVGTDYFRTDVPEPSGESPGEEGTEEMIEATAMEPTIKLTSSSRP
jgi:cytochrome c oxidase cbb3-type subunit I/II